MTANKSVKKSFSDKREKHQSRKSFTDGSPKKKKGYHTKITHKIVTFFRNEKIDDEYNPLDKEKINLYKW